MTFHAPRAVGLTGVTGIEKRVFWCRIPDSILLSPLRVIA
jgi:hypothetical protein